jgi:hypothetical protein
LHTLVKTLLTIMVWMIVVTNSFSDGDNVAV